MCFLSVLHKCKATLTGKQKTSSSVDLLFLMVDICIPWETWRKAGKKREVDERYWLTVLKGLREQSRRGNVPGQFGSIQQVSAACQPATSPSPTYGASYPHCSLWCLSRAACGCCPRLPSGLGPGRRRSWPRSTDGPVPGRWEEMETRDRSETTREKKEAIPHGRVHLSLSGFQGDDDENGTSVHPAHAAGVAHEVVQDCGEFCPHLSNDTTVNVSDVVFIRSQVKGRGCSLSKLLCLMSLIGDKRRTRSKVAFLKI